MEKESLLLQHLLFYNQRVETLGGKTLLVYRSGGKTLSFKAIVRASEGGNCFRIDLNDLIFDKPVVSVLRRKDEVVTVFYMKGVYYTWTYADFGFKEMVGFNIPKELILNSVLGKVYVFDGEITEYGLHSPALLIESEGSHAQVFFNNDSYPTKTLYTFQKETYTVNFGRFQKFESCTFPSKITIKNEESTLDIIYTDVVINSSVDETIFLIEDSELQNLEPGN